MHWHVNMGGIMFTWDVEGCKASRYSMGENSWPFLNAMVLEHDLVAGALHRRHGKLQPVPPCPSPPACDAHVANLGPMARAATGQE